MPCVHARDEENNSATATAPAPPSHPTGLLLAFARLLLSQTPFPTPYPTPCGKVSSPRLPSVRRCRQIVRSEERRARSSLASARRTPSSGHVAGSKHLSILSPSYHLPLASTHFLITSPHLLLSPPPLTTSSHHLPPPPLSPPHLSLSRWSGSYTTDGSTPLTIDATPPAVRLAATTLLRCATACRGSQAANGDPRTVAVAVLLLAVMMRAAAGR